MKIDNPMLPPKDLKGRSRELWKHYTAELESRNMFDNCDRSALERLCRMEAKSEALTRQFEDEPVTVQDRDGTVRRNPNLMALAQLEGLVADLKKSMSIGGYFRHKIEGKKPKNGKPSVFAALRQGISKEEHERRIAEWDKEQAAIREFEREFFPDQD